MTGEDRVADLLSIYLAARAEGSPRTPEELCRECPELIPELLRRAAAAEAMGQLLTSPLKTGETATYFPTHSEVDRFPARLGDYVVKRVLGQGGMGAVLLAEDSVLNRQVAVKVMQPQLAADAVARERFLREARAAAAVHHDHIVPIFHVGEEAGFPYLVMPLLVGESLEVRLTRDGAMPPSEVLRIGRETALGLVAAHARGLVHRDVKPGNLWLEAPTGRVKVLDFGLARAADGTDALTRPGAMAGTPGYMAPEQADGQEVDGRADLFSLGAVLYRCATGKPAFVGATLTAILRAVAEHDPRPPHEVNPSVSRPLSDLIMRLLAKEPGGRPASAEAVAEELTALANGVGLAASSAVARQPKRRALVVPVGLALVLTVITATLAIRGGVTSGPTPPEGPSFAESGGQSLAAIPSPQPMRYRGLVTVKVNRGKRLVKLTEPGALPLVKEDTFVIEAEADPPSYLYLVWVDPNHDVTPVYPWDPEKGWGSRPAMETPCGRVRLPEGGSGYKATDAKPGVATMVLLARPTPLDVPDEVVRKWFEELPELPLPPGGEGAAVWFDNYIETSDPDRPRTFEKVLVGDPFARWQGQLQKSVGDKFAFQTAVSFARTGNK